MALCTLKTPYLKKYCDNVAANDISGIFLFLQFAIGVN
jgi:hypothetical protein